MKCRSLSLALLLAACGAVLAGCASMDEETKRKAAGEILGARKDGSLASWDDVRIGEVEAAEFVRDRILPLGIVPLAEGQFAHTFEDVEIDRERGTIKANIVFDLEGDENPARGPSTATAITSDGYFLTAAHCVATEHVFVFYGDEDGPRFVRARIVWAGDYQNTDDPDLALLHAPVRPARHFALQQVEDAPRGANVITAGYGGGLNQAGGKVKRIWDWKKATSGARWRELYHDAPVVTGDSGGPTIDAEGQLLGINSEVRVRMFRMLDRDLLTHYHCRAIQPDPEWLRGLILADRAEPRSAPR